MADARQVLTSITQKPNISYPVLAPNLKGLEAAIDAGAKEVAIFCAASETFNKKNTNCTLEESLDRVKAIMDVAREKNVQIRGYVSCVVGCPYEGPVSPKLVADISKRLLDMGCYEISLGDTIGVGTPGAIAKMLDEVLKVAPADKFAVHTHDTYGQALANILCSLDYGIRTFDSSIAGLGGCPYAPGAKGNVATEDVVYMLHGSGYDTGIDLKELIHIGDWISQKLGRPTGSRAGSALMLAERRQQQEKAKL
jgi:hydroxymethylglutaryl-CoA lyase